jgi:hypothetical protein
MLLCQREQAQEKVAVATARTVQAKKQPAIIATIKVIIKQTVGGPVVGKRVRDHSEDSIEAETHRNKL